MASSAEFSVLSIALLHYAFDLSRDELIVVLTIILENSLDKFEPLPQSLVLYVELKTLSILIFKFPLHFLNVVTQFRVCLK